MFGLNSSIITKGRKPSTPVRWRRGIISLILVKGLFGAQGLTLTTAVQQTIVEGDALARLVMSPFWLSISLASMLTLPISLKMTACLLFPHPLIQNDFRIFPYRFHGDKLNPIHLNPTRRLNRLG